MTPTVDDFQALARSSPWRWTTLHLRHRSNYPGECEAWVRRPGELVVLEADGQVRRIAEQQLGQNRVYSSTDPDFVPPTVLPPQAVSPSYRPDGLVGSRPSGWELEYGDPMWGNYRWVAALDPVELSHHVAVSSLRVDEVVGRPAWRADLRAEPGYDPRCGGNCCELIWSEAGRVCEVEDPADAYHPPGYDYPDHYDVALDVQTGIVVRCLPVGGDPDAPWLENDVLAVDADVDDLFA